jgi:hypothetical protein
MTTSKLQVEYLYWANGSQEPFARFPLEIEMSLPKLRSMFHVEEITPDAVFIVDDCDEHQCMSVTNDAEQVTEFLFKTIGDKRIFYKDTMGQWDELLHNKGVFQNFKPGALKRG